MIFLSSTYLLHYTVKHVLSSHSKIDKTKVLKTFGTLMQVKSTAECSTGYLNAGQSTAECFTGAFCNTFDLH